MAQLLGAAAVGGVIGYFASSEDAATVEVEINDTLKAAINTRLDNVVQASANAICNNSQIVDGVTNCIVNFAPQTCEAAATSNYIGEQKAEQDLTQDIFREIRQTLEAKAEGLIPPSSSVSSINNIGSDLSITSSQLLFTDCSRNSTGFNTQSISDTVCLPGQEITFAEQFSTTEVLGDCASKQASKLKAGQKLANIYDIEATAESKGLDLMVFVWLMLAAAFLLLVIPIGIAKIANTAFKLLLPFLVVVAAIAVLIVYFAVGPSQGWYPYGFPYGGGKFGDDGPICTSPNGGVTEQVKVFRNQEGFWSTDCTASGSLSCTPEKSHITYEGCGLFSTCDDPNLIADKTVYYNLKGACDKLEFSPEIVPFCTFESFIKQAYVDPDLDIPTTSCKPCVSGSLLGSYVGIDKTCDASLVNPLRYMGTETSPCPVGDTNCVTTESELLAGDNANDCPNPAYQTRKGRVSRSLKACDEINLFHPDGGIKDTGTPIELSKICRPSVDSIYDLREYFNCDLSGKCYYVPQNCVETNCDDDGLNCELECTGVLEEIQKSCRNDYEGCLDPSYVKDAQADLSLLDTCIEQWEEYNSVHMVAFYIMLGIVGLLLFIAVVLFGVFRKFGDKKSNEKRLDFKKPDDKKSDDKKSTV